MIQAKIMPLFECPPSISCQLTTALPKARTIAAFSGISLSLYPSVALPENLISTCNLTLLHCPAAAPRLIHHIFT
jgi:hypothetical protein